MTSTRPPTHQAASTVPEAHPSAGWPHRRDPERLAVGGIDVAYRRDGHGEPTVVLHDAWFLRQWLPFHAALAREVAVLAPEAPGFGDSATDPLFEDLSDAVLHLDSFLRAQGLGAVHLVGIGFGARLAAHVAATVPDRVRTLTLIAPTGLRDDDAPLPDTFRLSTAELYARLFNGREDAHVESFRLKGFPDDQVDLLEDAKPLALFTWTQRFDNRLLRRAYRISAPTLVLAAEDERIASPTSAARFAKAIPGAELVVVPGPDGRASSHAVAIEQPDEVAALVLGHIRRGTEVTR